MLTARQFEALASSWAGLGDECHWASQDWNKGEKHPGKVNNPGEQNSSKCRPNKAWPWNWQIVQLKSQLGAKQTIGGSMESCTALVLDHDVVVVKQQGTVGNKKEKASA